MNIRTTLSTVGSVRDGMLVCGGVVYIAGYVTWALHAWNIGAGPAAALETQYFAVGVPLCFFALVGIFLMTTGRRLLTNRWEQYLRARPERERLAIQGGAFVAAVACGGVAIVLMPRAGPAGPGRLMAVLVAVMLSVFLLGLTQGSSYSRRQVATANLVLTSLTLIVIGTAFFVTTVYTEIPQELGGGRPRVARIDVRTADVSAETLQMLAIPLPPLPIARSQEILVVHMDDQTLLIFIGTGELARRRHLEISRSSVAAFEWIR
ncbi:MAG TPA: hypothetical protein VF698_04530 [Thermoanaerobaculia bacterium]